MSALPALQVKVIVDELNVELGTGLNMTAGPVGFGVGVGVGVSVGPGVGVGVGLPPGVGVGVGVGAGPPEQVENLNEPMRVIQFRPADE